MHASVWVAAQVEMVRWCFHTHFFAFKHLSRRGKNTLFPCMHSCRWLRWFPQRCTTNTHRDSQLLYDTSVRKKVLHHQEVWLNHHLCNVAFCSRIKSTAHAQKVAKASATLCNPSSSKATVIKQTHSADFQFYLPCRERRGKRTRKPTTDWHLPVWSGATERRQFCPKFPMKPSGAVWKCVCVNTSACVCVCARACFQATSAVYPLSTAFLLFICCPHPRPQTSSIIFPDSLTSSFSFLSAQPLVTVEPKTVGGNMFACTIKRHRMTKWRRVKAVKKKDIKWG